MYPIQVLAELRQRGFKIETCFWAPEKFDNSAEFMLTLTNYRNYDGNDPFGDLVITQEYIDENPALFVLCENQEPFRKRMTGEIVDNWFIKENFKIIASKCFEILEKQQNLEDWQIKLKYAFKEMIF